MRILKLACQALTAKRWAPRSVTNRAEQLPGVPVLGLHRPPGQTLYTSGRIIQVLRRAECEEVGVVTHMYAFKMSEAYEWRRECFCS